MEAVTKAQRATEKAVLKRLFRVIQTFPEIEEVYRRWNGETLEVYVVGDLSREREDEFYEQQANIVASLPVGAIWTLLFNRRNFEPSAELMPPEDAERVELQSV